MERKTHHTVKTAVDLYTYGGGTNPFSVFRAAPVSSKVETPYVQSNLVGGKYSKPRYGF